MEESRLAFEHRRLVDDAVLERFLAHAHRLLRSDGQLLLDSVDVRVTSDPLHLAYQEANRVAGRYIGEIRLQFEFRGELGPGCGWLHVDPETLQRHATAAGWQYELLREEENGDHLSRLVQREAQEG